MKISNKRGKKINFYLSVYEFIKSNKKLPDLAKEGISKQKLNYYVKALKQRGLIVKKGYGVWDVTDETFDVEEVKKNNTTQPNNTHSKVTEKRTRAHAFVFTLKLPKIKNWDKRCSYLKKKNIPHYLVYGKNPSMDIDNFKVHLNNNSLVLYLKEGHSVLSDSAKSGKLRLIDEGLAVIRKLEKELTINFSIRNKYKLVLLKQEYADIENELAKDYNSQKEKLAIYGDDGKRWLLIDNSFNLNELETVHPTNAADDMDNCIKPFFDDLRKSGPLTISEILNVNKELQNRLAEITKLQFESAQVTQQQLQTMALSIEALASTVHVLAKQNVAEIPEPKVGSKLYYVG